MDDQINISDIGAGYKYKMKSENKPVRTGGGEAIRRRGNLAAIRRTVGRDSNATVPGAGRFIPRLHSSS